MLSLSEDQLKVKALLAETVTLLCKNGLKYSSELRIEGLIGVTIDNDKVLLININEAIISARTRVPVTREKALTVSSTVQPITEDSPARPSPKKRQARNSKKSSFKPEADCSKLPRTTEETSSPSCSVVKSNILVDCGAASQTGKPSAKRQRLHGSPKPDQTLTLMVEDELFGDLCRPDVVKTEQNVNVEDEEPDEFCDAAIDSVSFENAQCSTWLQGDIPDAMDELPEKKPRSANTAPPATSMASSSANDDDAVDPDLVCSFCLQQFYDTVTLKVHERFHLLRLTCSICGAIFTTTKVMREHVAGQHGVERYVCDCGCKFTLRGTFLSHKSLCPAVKQK